MASKKKKSKKVPSLKTAVSEVAATGKAAGSDETPVNITEALASAAAELAAKGSARLAGVGKFSVRATQVRKGVRRRVQLRVEPEFQAKVAANATPEGGVARALVEALGGGETLRITGLGSFALTDHPATTNVHPRTRQTVIVPARRELTFSGATLGK